MVKHFKHCVAWTDAMEATNGFIGLIEYQPIKPGASVQILWVIAPHYLNQCEAETGADRMLQQIDDITYDGRVIYQDSVIL